MKKIILCSLTSLFAFTFIPNEVQATTSPVKTELPSSAKEMILINRLNQINTADKSELNFSEKKVLRKEVRSIEKALSDVGGGVYISVGALLLIILILIILL